MKIKVTVFVSVLRAFNFLHFSLKLNIIDSTNIQWKFVLQAVFSLSVLSKRDPSHEITVCVEGSHIVHHAGYDISFK